MTPLKIATAYGMLANGGRYLEPYLIERIENMKGEILYQAKPYVACDSCTKTSTSDPLGAGAEDTQREIRQAPRIAAERDIFILHSMLKDVINKGTGRGALALNRSDLAGKTGTTNDQKDAWFSGFNTELETSVWVGFDNPSSLGRREYGAKAALPIWNDYMRVALGDSPSANMKQPNGIVSVKINPSTGLLAGAGAEQTIFEIFRQENSPRQTSSSLPENTGNSSEAHTISPEDIF